jgi:hypothetical protein
MPILCLGVLQRTQRGELTHKKYNHAFSIAFEVLSDNEPHEVTANEIIVGILNKLTDFISNPSEAIENAGLPFDTFEAYVNENYREYR